MCERQDSCMVFSYVSTLPYCLAVASLSCISFTPNVKPAPSSFSVVVKYWFALEMGTLVILIDMLSYWW